MLSTLLRSAGSCCPVVDPQQLEQAYTRNAYAEANAVGINPEKDQRRIPSLTHARTNALMRPWEAQAGCCLF